MATDAATTTIPAHRYASIQTAADYAAVSPDTIRRLIARGKIHPYRAGKAIRVDLNDLDRAMARAAGRVA